MSRKLLMISVSVAASVLATSAFAGSSSSTVYLYQDGANESATIEQSNAIGARVGFAGQAFDQVGAGSNVLKTFQTGSYNGIGTGKKGYQNGFGNSADLSQYGNGSRIELQQNGTGNGTLGSFAWGGASNVVLQDGSSNQSYTDIYQNGAHNQFDVQQGGYANALVIDQRGQGEGFAYVRQGTGNSGSASGVTINQNTDANSFTFAYVLQSGGPSNSVGINQAGSFLYAAVDQNGGGSNVFSSSQSGYNNAIGVNTARSTITPVVQAGWGNSVYNTQVGDNGTVNGSQVGNSNSVNTFQGGNLNTLTFTQSGNGNVVGGYQVGTSNAATVVQVGYSNTANYTQVGSNGIASITQH